MRALSAVLYAVLDALIAGALLIDEMRNRTRRSGQIPSGHPESMTAELPRDQEELLAAYDAELFPQEAK